MHVSLSRGSLVLTLLLGPASFVAAQTKVDLSPFFAAPDQVGDYRIYQSETAPERRSELIEMGPAGKKTRFLVRYEEGGELISTEESFGSAKKLFLGDAFWPDDSAVDVKPTASLPLRMVQGKPFKFRAGGKLLYLGQKVGKVRLEGSSTFVAIEPIETPVFSLKETLRLSRRYMVTYRVRGAPVYVAISEGTEWIAPLLGTVRYTTRTRNYEDGVLIDDTGEQEYWLASGLFGGEPLP
jgi:hypothetical protein